MSSTNSSDWLTLLSYATFNYHIPIHDHSWRRHQWIQAETIVALASLALQSAKKLFQKGNLENKRVILTLSGADVRTRSVGIDLNTYWGLYRFFPGHFLRQWNLTTVSSGSDGGSLWRLLCLLVHPKTHHLKSLFGADSVYLQQLQQVISNGGGGASHSGLCLCLYGSVTNGRDFLPSVTWTEGESETACSERLFMII